MCAPPAPLHPVVTVSPFAKWGIYYMTCNPRLAGRHGYIIIAVDYFTKWAKVMPTLSEDGHTTTQFLFNHVISRFRVPQAIVTDHAYRTSVKDATGFTPFQLVYGLEATLPIECEIPSLKLVVELLPDTTPVEERLLYLERLDETRQLASLAIEAQKKRMKTHFDHTVHPRSFVEGDLVLLYDQANDKMGVGKFEPMWHGPYIVKRVLQKGAYELIDYEGNPLDKPRNGLYLKKYYA
eukprot:PITA_16268